MVRAALPFFMALSLSGCTQFPDLDHTQTTGIEAAVYPALVPIAPILARASGPQPDALAEEATLNARLTALRARAARMRGSILSGGERQRLEQGLR